MKNEILDRVIEATRLTRSGRVREATALLQGGFARGGSVPGSTPAAVADDVIDGECAEVGSEDARDRGGQASHADAPLRDGLKQFLRRWIDGKAPATDVPASTESPPGSFAPGAYANTAGERSYRLYVPTRYAGQALPLIMMLHGCKQTPDDFAAGTRMNDLGEEHGCFVLYPGQSGAANPGGCWNWFRKEDQVRDQGEPSILAGMLRHVMERHSVDGRRVYVAGLSAGGAMAAVLAVTYPDLFAGVGIHSGLACGSAHDLTSALAAMKGMPAQVGSPTGSRRAMPTIVFHGDHDRTVHPRNGANVISQSPHHDDADNRTTTERGQAPGGHAYTKMVHRNSTGRVVLEHWIVHGGGHAWFGGDCGGSYTDPRGPSASREMARFFLQDA